MDELHIAGEHTLEDRRRALEDAFFARRNRELVEQHRAKREAEQELEALANITGIKSATLLERLMQQGVNSETLIALSLIPLITVAWADEELDEQEREAILRAASEAGIEESSASAKLLKGWMRYKPGPELVSTWRDYVGSLTPSLEDEELEELKQEIMQRAHDVAFAAGGFMGIFAINPREEKALEELATAFDR